MDTLGFFIERGWGFDNGNLIGGLTLDIIFGLFFMLYPYITWQTQIDISLCNTGTQESLLENDYIL